MEPITAVALGAAIGGASGKLAEKAWDSGEKWLKSFFKDHGLAVNQNAAANTLDFLTELAQRVKLLEENNQVSPEKISSVQDNPDFSVLLQKAILASSQTDSKEKHIILAEIVSTRLKTHSNSIYSLGSKLACDAVSYATSNQLLLLGLTIAFRLNPPSLNEQLISNTITSLLNSSMNGETEENIRKNLLTQTYDSWYTKILKPFQDVKFNDADLLHLQSLSCIMINFTIKTKNSDAQKPFREHAHLFDISNLNDTHLRDSIIENYNKRLSTISLNTVGELIGVSVLNELTKSNYKPSFWEEDK